MSAVGVYRPSELERKYAECLPMLGVDASGRNIGERVDTLIVGSDEVFNCFQAGPNVGFCRQLLGAGNHCGRLISYAASFGSVTCEQIRELGARDELRSLLSGFDALSVRDANSESVLDFLGLALHDRHLDPALVSGIEGFSWREPGVAGGYALVYGYGRRFTAEEGRTIRSVAERRGLRVISVYGDQLFCDENVVCRPDEILGYFKRADIVFTDTFHGTIFSAITHRPMVVIWQAIKCEQAWRSCFAHGA